MVFSVLEHLCVSISGEEDESDYENSNRREGEPRHKRVREQIDHLVWFPRWGVFQVVSEVEYATPVDDPLVPFRRPVVSVTDAFVGDEHPFVEVDKIVEEGRFDQLGIVTCVVEKTVSEGWFHEVISSTRVNKKFEVDVVRNRIDDKSTHSCEQAFEQ